MEIKLHIMAKLKFNIVEKKLKLVADLYNPNKIFIYMFVFFKVSKVYIKYIILFSKAISFKTTKF